MSDTPAEVEAARALVAAYDALNSPKHAAEAEQLRELSLQVAGRVEAYAAAQAALHAANAGACANGTPPADNTIAARVIAGHGHGGWETGNTELDDLKASYADDELFDVRALPDEDDIPEEQTARSTGALS
jgi:hypothetical protein